MYVASRVGNSISHFSRDADAMTFRGCIADRGANGCTNVGEKILAGAGGVALSPAGNSVYVSGSGARSLSHFRRELAGDRRWRWRPLAAAARCPGVRASASP